MPNSHPILKLFNQITQWVIICLLISCITGTVTAFFLHSLDWVTTFRENHFWIIYSLPFIGFLIGFIYHQYGDEANKGNNVIIEAHHTSNQNIPFKMAPLVYIGTILTHLAGGSAGREGTAVQMGGAIAAPFAKWFKINDSEKKTIIIMGVSAGFAAVFGTPWAGAIFALELMGFKYIRWQSILPSFAAAYLAHFICLQWDIKHSIYVVNLIPSLNLYNLVFALFAGLLFGLTALLFSLSNRFWENIFNKIKYKPLRPFIGGIIIIIVILLLGSTKYIGLGIPEIMHAFTNPSGKYDFMIKLLLTSFTLSVGFKGGEVTPLFFIGATLGSSLVLFIPLPFALLAAMGFVAVFAGATHCVIASIILGIEIFGINAGMYIGIASIAAYFSSGPIGIYSAKIKSGAKFSLYNYFKKISSI
ncbi:MAG: H(+)/Cl(-) exchange transporter ClcA [Bacteroidota bacterium]|jgi:H+/Cl- antiporter ClcA